MARWSWIMRLWTDDSWGCTQLKARRDLEDPLSRQSTHMAGELVAIGRDLSSSPHSSMSVPTAWQLASLIAKDLSPRRSCKALHELDSFSLDCTGYQGQPSCGVRRGCTRTRIPGGRDHWRLAISLYLLAVMICVHLTWEDTHPLPRPPKVSLR